MELIDKYLLTIHVIAGFTSLFVFILPLISKKGGDIHRKTGRLYVYSMWVVVITALVLSIINAVESNYITALFLGYLAILTSNPLWYGISILKYGFKPPESLLRKKRAYELVVFLIAIFNISVFIYLQGKGQSILLLIFGLLGLTAMPQAFASIMKLKEKANPVADHVEAMITTGIAAYTAFFVFGGYSFFENLYKGHMVVLFWTLPGIIGGICISRLRRKYTKRQFQSAS